MMSRLLSLPTICVLQTSLLAFSILRASAWPVQQNPPLDDSRSFFPYCSPNAVVDVFGSDIRLFSSATAFCNDYLASKTTITTIVTHTVFSTRYPTLTSLAPSASPTAQAVAPIFPYLTSPAAQAPSAILPHHRHSDPTNTQAPFSLLVTSFSPSSRSAACSCLVSPTTYTIVQTVLAPEETQWVVPVEVHGQLLKWHTEEKRKWNTEESRNWPFGKGAEMVMWDEVSDGMEVRTPLQS